MRLLVCSVDDPASANIRAQLLRLAQFERMEVEFGEGPVLMLEPGVALVTLSGELTEADAVDGLLNAELAVFLSRHESQSKEASLLAHVPGNWTSRAEAGGRPRGLCRAPATALKEALRELAVQRELLGLSSWRLGVEATHHGPFLERTPAIFIEVGSGPGEWRDRAACLAVARAAMRAARAKASCRSVIGLGGGHYAPKFTQLLLESELGVSYIAPKYVIDELDEALLRAAIERSVERVECLALDWKGLTGAQRAKVLRLAEGLGIRAERVEGLLRTK
ncbi:MAG: D-aminoacyl-tRNA deacylase [Candidatus Nezhaarchaeales archaeon]